MYDDYSAGRLVRDRHAQFRAEAQAARLAREARAADAERRPAALPLLRRLQARRSPAPAGAGGGAASATGIGI
jgi:hypothetical protein